MLRVGCQCANFWAAAWGLWKRSYMLLTEKLAAVFSFKNIPERPEQQHPGLDNEVEIQYCFRSIERNLKSHLPKC